MNRIIALLFQLTILIAFIMFFSGCSQLNTMPDQGRDFSQESVSQLKVGETTVEDAILLLGQPQNRSSNSDGSSILNYMFAEAHPSAFDLFGNKPGYYDRKALTLNFDTNGKLKGYTQSGNQ